MADGFAELDAQIARVRGLAGFVRGVAPEVADACRAELKRQIGAGVGPDGKPWQPREDGEQPLQNAAASLNVAAVGTSVIMVIRDHVARHHRGRARGGVVRQVIPVSAIPAPMVAAIRRVLSERFEEAMNG